VHLIEVKIVKLPGMDTSRMPLANNVRLYMGADTKTQRQ